MSLSSSSRFITIKIITKNRFELQWSHQTLQVVLVVAALARPNYFAFPKEVLGVTDHALLMVPVLLLLESLAFGLLRDLVLQLLLVLML